MYKIQINPTALHLIQKHPVAIPLCVVASITLLQWVIRLITRAGREEHQQTTIKPTQTIDGQRAHNALEHMVQDQNTQDKN